MREFLARYIQENIEDLLKFDIKIARLLGIPAPHTLSSYAHTKHGFWEKVFDKFFHYVRSEENHCYNDYLRVTGKAVNA